MRKMSDISTSVLAVDPGGVTGVAWWIDGQFSSWEVNGGRFGFYDAFEAMLERVDFTHIVCEDFIVTAKTARMTQQPDAMRVIGFLEAWTRKHGVHFTLQTPSTAKQFGTDAKLKHFGYFDSTSGGHKNDAARHLLTYLMLRLSEPNTLQHLKGFTL